MKKKDLRFASWVISITSILYGVVALTGGFGGGFSAKFYGWETIVNNSLHFIPITLLVIFGASKMAGILLGNRIVRRVSIVGLMFCWGFVWVSSLVSFFTVTPNRTAITLIPIIAISMFVAMRGDYSDG